MDEARVRQQLLMQRQALLELDLVEHARPALSPTSSAPAQGHDLSQLVVDAVAEIDHALRKLATARFGTCEACGDDLADEIIAISPQARLCARHDDGEQPTPASVNEDDQPTSGLTTGSQSTGSC